VSKTLFDVQLEQVVADPSQFLHDKSQRWQVPFERTANFRLGQRLTHSFSSKSIFFVALSSQLVQFVAKPMQIQHCLWHGKHFAPFREA